MFRHSKREAVVDRAGSVQDTASDLAGRAVEAAGVAAERATSLAQSAVVAATPVVKNAKDAATPVVRSAASSASEKLSEAAERAAIVLADTAERLADAAPEGALTTAPRSLAKTVRPKRRSKWKLALLVTAMVGAAVALFKSPLACKVKERLAGGPYPDEPEPEAITLPADQAPIVVEETDPTAPEGVGSGSASRSAPVTDHRGNGALSPEHQEPTSGRS